MKNKVEKQTRAPVRSDKKTKANTKISIMNTSSISFSGPLDENVLLRVAFEKQAYANLISHAKEFLDVEICGILIGKVFEDGRGSLVSVRASIRGESAQEENIQVTFTQETWNHVFQLLDNQYQGLSILGWYHSHPGFGVEFSDLDLFVHQNFFPAPTQIALVTDPLNNQVAICLNGEHGIVSLDRFWVDYKKIQCEPPASIKKIFQIEEIKLKLDEALNALEQQKKRLSEVVTGDVDDLEINLESFLIDDAFLPSMRVFPKVAPSLYDFENIPLGLNPDQRAAFFMLGLSSQEFSFQQEFRRRNLSILGRFSRLLLDHKMAIEAETKGLWERADFYWRELYLNLRNLYYNKGLWENLTLMLSSEIPGINILADPYILLERFRDEILICTHIMFYNSLVNKEHNIKLNNRAFVHYEYLQDLYARFGEANKNTAILLIPPMRLKASILAQHKQWAALSRLYKKHLSYCSEDLKAQNELAQLNYTQTIQKLNNKKSRKKRLKDVKVLSAGIAQLTNVRKDFLYNSSLNLFLAKLHQLKAIQLNQLKGYSEALTEAQKALVFYDQVDSAEEKEKPLIEQEIGQINLSAQIAHHNHWTWNFPFKYWFLSTQNKRLKIQMIIAITLVVFAGGLALYDWQARSIRQQAFQQLLEAVQEEDYQKVLASGDRFFSVSPLNNTDSRQNKVRDLSNQALVRWMIFNENSLTDEDLKQLARFNKWLLKAN